MIWQARFAPERIVMNSLDMRLNPLFHRSEFDTDGFFELPVINRVNLNDEIIRMIPLSKTKRNDSDEHCKFGVHCFEDDYRLTALYNNPERAIDKLMQYAFICTPDYSTYSDMDVWRQLESVAHSRWVGAYWQKHGITVIPTVSWSDKRSFLFCFDSIISGSDIAVGTIGCKHSKKSFLYGYDAMLEKLAPKKVFCVGKPFDEMRGNVIAISDEYPRRAVC